MQIGKTVMKNGKARLVEKFPICLGGLLEFTKEGYHTYTIRFDTQRGKEEVIIASASPGSPKNVQQVK